MFHIYIASRLVYIFYIFTIIVICTLYRRARTHTHTHTHKYSYIKYTKCMILARVYVRAFYGVFICVYKIHIANVIGGIKKFQELQPANGYRNGGWLPRAVRKTTAVIYVYI